MAWQSLTIAHVRLSPQEKAAFEALQGSSSIGAEITTAVVAEFRDAIAAVGGTVGSAGTVPDLVRIHAINRIRWLWLCEFPQLKSHQTEERKALAEAAQTMLNQILSREISVPDASAGENSPAGSWNSENKILGRTSPVPRPGAQGTDDYANPDAPQDEEAT